MPVTLITGAAGFIGFHLAGRLLSQGETVVGFDNINDYYDPALKHSRLELLSKYPNFTFVKGDLADRSAVDRLFSEYRPQSAVHLAAQAGVRYSIDNPQVYIDSNITGTFNILEACRNFPVGHLVYASSSSVYGNQEKTPFSISDNVDNPVSLYAATKKSNELMAYTYSHLYKIPSTGLRFFTVYGPYGRPDMAYFNFTRSILEGRTIQVYGNGDMYRDFTYIDDIVQGILAVLSRPPQPDSKGVSHKLYNIGNNNPERLEDFISILENHLCRKAVREYLPMQPGDVYQTYADVDGLIDDFGFKPNTSLDSGLKKFTDWYKEYYNIT
ncbi:MAG: NAD-dependent epimerase [Oscillospiraceae bacterium]|nr:NAD-dependent epimerase [Oscillospiraceae bacterium]